MVVDDDVAAPPEPVDIAAAAAGDEGRGPGRMSCCVVKSSICGDEDDDEVIVEEGDMGPNGRFITPLPAAPTIIIWRAAASASAPDPEGRPPAPCSSCAYRMRSGYGTTVCCCCGGRIAVLPG